MRVVAECVPDAVLVRLAVRGEEWAEHIPPLPDGFDVSVSFSCEETADLHGAALRLLGYRVVPAAALDPDGVAEALFLVPRALARRHRTYYRALLAEADRAYDLAFGPAAALVAGVLPAHRGSGEGSQGGGPTSRPGGNARRS